MARASFKNVLKKYFSKLSDLVHEQGGKPIINFILTTWRSGSTFLGAILDSHPANFYHFEPLQVFFSYKVIRELPESLIALKYLKFLFQCNYSKLGKPFFHLLF